jgi:hypothetical protein
MSEPRGDTGGVAEHNNGGVDELARRWQWLAAQPAPTTPPGLVGSLANRMLVYTRSDKVPTVLPLLDARRSGLMLAGASASDGMRLLEQVDYDGIKLTDPAKYERQAATPDAPFVLPDGQLMEVTLEDILESQLRAGASAALTPTAFVEAGDTDSLKAAVRAVRALDRTDTILVAPLDISLLGKKFIRQTTAILADAGCPVGLILGKQGDPIAQSKDIIPNLRQLALQVPLVPIRTDFNAFDLVAHGAIAGALGTGGSLRHTVDPAKKPMSGNPADQSPSVLFPHLACWWRGSKIAKLFGARRAPRCSCAVCDGDRLNRFLHKSDQEEAISHGVAVWMEMAVDMLDAPTMRDRARYWRNVCQASIAEHKSIANQLQQIEALKPQAPLERWATLPAWPVGEPATA